MGLTFFELYHRLFEADMPPPPASGANTLPPPPANDPLGGGMPPPPMGDPSMGGGQTPMPAKAKIIKITTVWDALENVLGKVAQPKSQESKVAKKEVKKSSSLSS
jgi:mono/diheme cytochrome c family protein